MPGHTRNLRDKYCIVGVGETEYSRGSGRTTRAMAVEAVRNAILDDGPLTSVGDGILDHKESGLTFARQVSLEPGILISLYVFAIGRLLTAMRLVGAAG